MRGRKRSLFEGGVRVPGILEWPQRVEAGRVSDVPASTCDYFPAIAEVLGLGIPEDDRPIDGVSLLSLIEGDMEERGRPIAFQCPNGGERGAAARLGSPDHALIGDRYKLLSFLDEERSGEDMLFDIALDPGERHDLIEDLPDVAAEMKQYLLDWDASCARSDEGADYTSG